MQTADDERAAWVMEAHRVISQWEEVRGGRMLSIADAATLADRIAQALQAAYDRGRAAAAE